MHVFPCIAENPFDNKVFLSDILPWFAKLPPAELRTKVVQKGLIRSLASIDRLKRSLDRDGPSHHNEDIIGLISARELEGYLALCDIIHDMGYKERSVQMRKLVLEDGRQEIGENCRLFLVFCVCSLTRLEPYDF